MGINSINFLMKRLISNSPLQKSEKHLANHSARKTLVKKLKQQQVPKSKIISISRHNRETGWKNNCPILLATITPMHPNLNTPSLQITQYSKSIVFLLSKWRSIYQNISASNLFSFNNCAVYFQKVQNVSSSVENLRKHRRRIYSSHSSQDKWITKKLSLFASC